MDISDPAHTLTGGGILDVAGMSDRDFIIFIIGNENGSGVTEEEIKDRDSLVSVIYALLKVFPDDGLSSDLGKEISIISDESTRRFECTCLLKTIKDIVTIGGIRRLFSEN